MELPTFDRQPDHPTFFSTAEAFAAVILAAIAADGYLAAQEVDAVMFSLARMHLFADISLDSLRSMLQKLHAALKQSGNALFLKAAKDALPPELHETAFAVAADLVLADGWVAEDEHAFLQMLCQTFGITTARAREILTIMVIKNRG
jgi:hypothetical protein